jgi:hypothetical protein
MKELVFIHGRSQQDKDSIALKAEWIEAFAQGLSHSGLKLPIAESAVRFPYYGDTLAGLVGGKPANEVAEVIVRGDNADEAERGFQLEVLREIQKMQPDLSDEQVAAIAGEEVIKKGPLNWGWVRAILTGIDRHVPFGSSGSIALFTKDVYQYLKNPGIRDAIETGVRKAMSSTPCVVVSHSLGSVVAYNLLRREGANNGWNVPLLVTVGCPLAVTAIHKWLAPNKHPECASHWFNAMDSRDIVALHPLNASHGWDISPAIENKTDVNNQTSNRHGISGYLGDAVIAKRIYDALVA